MDDSLLTSLGLDASLLTPSRTNGFANMLETMRRRTRVLVNQLPSFPSLLITADALQPQGSFAEVQAQYLRPDPAQVWGKRVGRRGKEVWKCRRGGNEDGGRGCN